MAGKKTNAKKKEKIKAYYNSGTDKKNKQRRFETSELHRLVDAENKKRRLTARLKTFGVTPESTDTIAKLRSRLRKFIVKPKLMTEWQALREKIFNALGVQGESIKTKR